MADTGAKISVCGTSHRVHNDQGKSGNQGIIREFTKLVFFLKKSGNYQGI